jgi:hypothetical protein
MSSRRNKRTNKKFEKKITNETITNEIINEDNDISIEEIYNEQERELEKRECCSDKILRLSYNFTIYFFDTEELVVRNNSPGSQAHRLTGS